MQEQVQPQIIQPEPTKVKKHSKKLFIAAIIACVFVLLSLVVILAYVASSNNDPIEQNPIIPTATLPPTITPTQPILFTPTAFSQNRYVLSGCEVEMILDDETWSSAPRGTYNSCGLFYTGESAGLTDLSTYQGAVIAFLRADSDSPFGIGLARGVREYLESLPTDESRFSESRDFLYSLDDDVLGGQHVQRAEIYKVGVGDSVQYFYKVNGIEYIVIYGGKLKSNYLTEVKELLNSLKYLTAFPTVIN